MKSERNAALVMMFAAMVGLLLANSPFGQPVLNAIDFKLNLDLININITLGHVVSDLFLAVFFFVAGLELKYELTTGTLSSPKRALVPVVAAIAGVAVPSAIYAYLNWGTEAIVGWPIPAATDIAFVLGLLAIFGRGMPKEARIFLLALAIFDDLVAIAIIAIFYTADAQPTWLLACIAVAIAFRFAEMSRSKDKWLIRAGFGIILWYTVYQSGVHATIAGVLLGVLIPATRAHGVIAKVQPATLLDSSAICFHRSCGCHSYHDRRFKQRLYRNLLRACGWKSCWHFDRSSDCQPTSQTQGPTPAWNI